jgi:hypothetical protein
VAVARSTCSDAAVARRGCSRVDSAQLAGRVIWLDGYNVLTTIEAALSGGVILAARDGTYRDMASMHGSYRKVSETRPALELLGRVTAALKVDCCRWYLDRPVSNSGRLKALMAELLEARVASSATFATWNIDLVDSPDATLVAYEGTVATCDSAILDRCSANDSRHDNTPWALRFRISASNWCAS